MDGYIANYSHTAVLAKSPTGYWSEESALTVNAICITSARSMLPCPCYTQQHINIRPPGGACCMIAGFKLQNCSTCRQNSRRVTFANSNNALRYRRQRTTAMSVVPASENEGYETKKQFLPCLADFESFFFVCVKVELVLAQILHHMEKKPILFYFIF